LSERTDRQWKEYKRQTDRQTAGRTDRQTDRWTDRQTDRQMDGRTGRQLLNFVQSVGEVRGRGVHLPGPDTVFHLQQVLSLPFPSKPIFARSANSHGGIAG
jgi:hypothetical protein